MIRFSSTVMSGKTELSCSTYAAPESARRRLEDGRTLNLAPGDPQLRHVDRAWASTVHAFQGRTVDTVIAAMEANHQHLTTQKSFYVEISGARDRAELVTDDKAALNEQLEAATGAHRGAGGGRFGARKGPGGRIGCESGARQRARDIRTAATGPGAGVGTVPCAEGYRTPTQRWRRV